MSDIKAILNNIITDTSEDITVILSVYSRPNYFERLINEIDKIKYHSIWISCWYSPNYEIFIEKYEKLKKKTKNKLYFFSSNFQLKYFGRFQLAYQVSTKYTLILDDDCLIQPKFHELCLKMINMPKYNGLLGVKGWIFPEKNEENLLESYGQGKFYYPKPAWKKEDDTKFAFEIDIVGGAWFFRKEWILYMFREFPYTFETGEDFHFSYMLRKYGNIKTYFIPNDNNYKEYWGCSHDFSTIDMSSNSRSDNAGDIRKQIFWKQYLGLCPFVKRIENKCSKTVFLLFDEQEQQIYLELCKNKELYIPIVISDTKIILKQNKNYVTFYYCNELHELSYVIKMIQECFELNEIIFYINQQKTNDLIYIKNFNYKLININIKFMNDYNLGDGFNKYILRFLLCNENLNFRTPEKNKYLIKNIPLDVDINNILLNILCTGSILPSLCNNDYALCSGIQYIENKRLLKCNIFNGKFLRGPLSKKYIEDNISINLENINYFDLGLLLPLLYTPKKSSKKYKLGIIPHHKERTIFSNINHHDICIIDILCCKNFDYICKNFVDKLCECDVIISSSLHGIIIADAYNIPNITFKKTNLNSEISWIKFKDYYSSINRKFEFKDISEYMLNDLTSILLDNIFLQYINTNYQKVNIDYNDILTKMKFVHPEVIKKTLIYTAKDLK